MQRNKTILHVGLVMLMLSLVLSLGLTSYMRLDQPVFLYNYKECNILSVEGYYNKRHFDFSYITNANDSRYVTGISFPGTDALGFSVVDPAAYLSSSYHDDYGQYTVRKVNVTVTDLDVEDTFDPVELSRGVVTLSDGEKLEVDFGRVLVTNHDANFPSVEFISTVSSSMPDQSYRNISTFKAAEALTLLGIDSPLFRHLGDLVSLEINGIAPQDIEGMVFEKDDLITITTQMATDVHLDSSFTSYEIQPVLTWQDGDGESHKQILSNIDHTPYRFQLSGILKYLKERGAL